MSETSLVNAIIAEITNKFGGRLKKHHGSNVGDSGQPDIYGVVFGLAVFLEVKTPRGDEPTPLQYSELEKWAAAGAVTGVVRSVAGAIRILSHAREGCRVSARKWKHLRQLQKNRSRMVENGSLDNTDVSN